MTKSELIEAVAARTDLPKKRAEELVNTVIEAMRGFGSFSIKHYAPYRGRNPKTGEPVDVGPKKSIHFKVGKDLRERVNAGYGEPLKD